MELYKTLYLYIKAQGIIFNPKIDTYGHASAPARANQEANSNKHFPLAIQKFKSWSIHCLHFCKRFYLVEILP